MSKSMNLLEPELIPEPVQIGNATLYLGDSGVILPSVALVDLILTDPPYGIGEAKGKNKSRGTKVAPARDFGTSNWDDAPAPTWLIELIRARSRSQIIFGGNYYSLPPSSCWLVWDKEINGDFADCELAWTNLAKAVRRIKFRWNGMLQENMGMKETRVHPTQKPIPVIRWALEQAGEVETVCDPFMGSGTTGVACIELGKQFIGIERDPNHFESACRRIELAVQESRTRLFESA